MTKEKLIEKIKRILETNDDLDFLLGLKKKSLRNWSPDLEIGYISWANERT